ncbi:hypothetical protein KFK09_000571 [Dendrobium nobile]|uniref:Uncharacterized protein n=1 Tax=Dendrobium nobile TaxID=94219 RepID=A0A8T3CC96_DENNO|nr:hypothetical protein KFK09_000571 [Dendrobium nobile]
MKKTPSPTPLAAGESPGIDAPAIHPLSRRTQSFPCSSPLRSASSSTVPFSWEHEPGIPKNPRKPYFNSNLDRIPLPPPIRFDSMKTLSEADPFAAALAECAKETPPADPELEEFLRRRSAARRRRTAVLSPGGGLSLSGLYVSCKASAAACSVVESTVRVPRTGSVNRRLG